MGDCGGRESRLARDRHLVGEFGQFDTFELAPARGVEEAEFHPLGMTGEKGEIDAAAVEGCP